MLGVIFGAGSALPILVIVSLITFGMIHMIPGDPATMLRLPVTLALSAYSLVITLVLGLVTGVIAALRQNTWIDQAAMIFAMIGISLPNFYLAC